MRKYIIKTLLVVIGFTSVISCYKDKGNYDYESLGSVEIVADSMQYLYRIMMGADLEIKPYFVFNDMKEEDLTYKWEVSKENMSPVVFKVLSTERNLKYPITESPGNYDLRYTVTDSKTGISVLHKCKLEVTDAIARALLLLCRVPGTDNEFDISAANEFATIGRPAKNIYSEVNGQTIKDAVKLTYYTTYGPQWGVNYDMLCVFKKNGGEELSSFDLSYQKDASEWFFEALNNIAPQYLGLPGNSRQMILISNGGVHFCEPRYVPRKFRLRAEMIDGSPYHVGGVIYLANSNKFTLYAFWDDLGKRFIQWHFSSNNLQKIDAVEGAFDPNTIGDKTPIYIGAGFKDRSHCFMKDSEGNVHLYSFKNKATIYYSVDIAPYEHAILDKNLELDKATMVCSSYRADIIYYAVGSKIWIFDPVTKKRRLFLDFGDSTMNIVDMFHKDAYSYTVFVAANKGKEGYVYRISTTATGDLNAGTPEFPVTYDTMGPYDEIVDMEYKYRGW